MHGWRITIVLAVALVASNAALLGFHGATEEGVRSVVRMTARTSIVLFGLAFTASSLRRLWKVPLTKFLLRERRSFGVSFAFSHLLHALALLALARWFPDPFVAELDVVTLVGGGLAFALIAAMAATSSDAAVRVLGRTSWRRLHLYGSIYCWIIFAQSYLPRAFVDVAYVPWALLTLALVGVRLWARQAGRQPAAAVSAPG